MYLISLYFLLFNKYNLIRKETIMCGNNNGSAGDAVYGLGVIGAAIYFISTSTGFWMGALGILKALVWPAFFVYEALKFLM